MARQSLLSVVLGIDSRTFNRDISQAAQRLQKFSASATRAGRSLSVGVTAPLTVIGASSFKVAADFELAMKKVAAVSGAVGDDFKRLESNARDLGAATVFSASQVSALQLEFAKLGFSGGEIINATKDTLALAQAFDQELAPTATVVGSTLRQFGLDASETGRVADVMAKGFASSALDLEKFGEGMKNVAPVANEFGFSLEETTALLGVLANNGIAGSDAGTKLKIAFSELAASGVDVKSTFEGLISGGTSYTEAIDTLGKRAAILTPVFGKNLESLSELRGELNLAVGSAQSMAAAMNDSASGGLAAMRSAIEGAQISIGQALAPAITKVVEKVTELSQRFSRLSPQTQSIIVKLAGFAAALGPILFAVGKVTKGIRGMILVFRTLKVALATNPLGLILVAATALIPVISNLVSRFKSLNAESQVSQRLGELVAKSTTKQETEVQKLLATYKRANNNLAERRRVIEQLQALDPVTFRGLIAERDGYSQVAAAVDTYTDSLKKAARAKARQTLLDELSEQIVTLENEIKAEAQDFAQTDGFLDLISDGWKRGVDKVSGFVNAANSDLLQNLKQQRDLILDEITGDVPQFSLEEVLVRLDATEENNNRIKDETKRLTANIAAYNKALSELGAGGFAEGTQVFDQIKGELLKLESQLKQTAPEQITIEPVNPKSTENIRTANQVLSELKSELDQAGQLGEVFGASFDTNAEKASALESAIRELISLGLDAGSESIQGLVTQLNALQETTENVSGSGSFADLNKSLSELEVSRDLGIISDIELATAAVRELESALLQATLADSDFVNTDKYTSLKEQIESLKTATEGYGAATEEVKNTIVDTGTASQLVGDLANAAFDSATGSAQSFGEAAKGIFISLVKSALSTALANAIASAFSPASPDNIATGGAAAPAKAAALTGAISGLFSSIPALATGGLTTGPTLALIGDNASGREAVIPFERMGEFLGKYGGGGSTTVHGRIQGTDILLSSERSNRNRGR